MFDVVVIGAGPAGLATAKKCAEEGLETLVVEKCALPRKKVCDAIMSVTARNLIADHYGEFPSSILCEPAYLVGITTHISGIGTLSYEDRLPLIWRSDLDDWMCQQVKAKGVDVWEKKQFTNLSRIDNGNALKLRDGEKTQKIEAKFVVGADGASSRVRKLLFPKLKFIRIVQGLDLFEGEIELDPNYYHEFFDLEAGGLMGFSVHQKDGLIILSYAAEKGDLDAVIRRTKELLSKEHGFTPKGEPVWMGRCQEPAMAGELGSGQFKPVKGNVLLVGDAGGCMFPVEEGIGPGIRSGILAAESIKEALGSGGQAEPIYLKKLKPLLSAFQQAHEEEMKIVTAANTGGEALLSALAASRAIGFHPDY
jgi:flavin-dependent dehydrogenase